MASTARVREGTLNLKLPEWKAIFPIVDRLSEDGVRSRVLLSGRELPESRLIRARRHLKAAGRNLADGPSQGSGKTKNLKKVTAEKQNNDGNWILVKDFGSHSRGDPQPRGTSSRAPASVPPHNADSFGLIGPMDILQNDEGIEHIDNLELTFTNTFSPLFPALGLDPYAALPQASGYNSLDPSLDLQQIPGQTMNSYGHAQNIFSPLVGAPSSPLSVLDYGNILRSLPSKELEGILQTHGISFTTRVPRATPPLAITPIQNNHIESFLICVQNNIPRSNSTALGLDENHFHPQDILKSLKHLALDHIYCQQLYNPAVLKVPDDVFNSAVDFNQLLLRSIANGSAIVHGIPLGGILAYLSRFSDSATLMTTLLSKSNGPVSRALAENTFRAAIEAKDKRAVEQFIATRMLDINSIACTHQGRQYTPIERAASLHSLDVVGFLLEMNADANMSFVSDARSAGVLATLISGLSNGERVEQPVIQLARKLSREKSRAHPKALSQAVNRLKDPDLIYVLAWNEDLFSMVAILTDETLTKILRQCFEACEQEHRDKCLIAYGNIIDWVLIRAAVHGHPRLVNLLLGRHTPVHSYQLFSAAIRGRNEHIIRTVRAISPDLDGPPHSIDTFLWEVYGKPPLEACTSFSEAIKARDDELTNMIANAGALSSLNKAGAVPKRLQRGRSPLFMALVRRNRNLVHILLDADPPVDDGQRLFIWKGRETCLLLEALYWGDRIILDKIRRTFPCAAILPCFDFTKLSQSGAEELFRELHRDGLVPATTLSKVLQTAIKINDMRLATLLLELGARVSDVHISQAVEVKSAEFLDYLLKNTRHTSECVPREFGTRALTRAIGLGPSGIDLVGRLLGSRLIDIDGPTKTYNTQLRSFEDRVSPLWVAIKQGRACPQYGLSTVQKLLQSSANPNSVAICAYGLTVNNQSPLLLAIETQNCELVDLLISKGADYNAEAKYGHRRTPLQKAAEAPSLEIVKLLLAKGVKVDEAPATRGGGTAIQLAAIGGSVAVACELLSHGARLDSPPPSKVHGRWPLEGAAEHGNIDMIAFLWRAAQKKGVVFSSEMCAHAIKLARNNGNGGCAEMIESLQRENKPVSLPRFPEYTGINDDLGGFGF